MLRRKAILKFLWNHAWWRPLLSRCTACNLEPHLRKASSNVFSSNLFEITHNFYPTGWTTAIRCPLSYHVYSAVIPRQVNINSNALLNAIICDAYHSQHTSIDQHLVFMVSYLIFPGRQLLPTSKNTLNLNHGLSYPGKIHLLVPPPLSESKD